MHETTIGFTITIMSLSSIYQSIIDALIPWFISHGFKIVLILIAVFVLKRFGKVFIEKAIRKAVVRDHFLSREAEKKREDTLISISTGTFNVLIIIIAGLMILQEVGVDGQYLIRDVISGLFIILENQYRVGDVACFDGTCGLVEGISLRMTTLRDLDGTVHHIPHGEIKKVSNLSKYYSRVNLNIGIAYNSDLEKVIKVVNKVGNDLAKDPQWKDLVVKAPQFLRVDDFADSAIIIKILGETKPIKQWDVTGELRKRLKIAFDKEAIEIPFPQRVIHQVK